MVEPTITTERLILRPFTLDDVDELAVLHAEESFWHFPFRRGLTRDETQDFVERQVARHETSGLGLRATVEQETGVLVGWMGLQAPDWLPEVLPAVEVGWRLGRRFWGRGYATEGGAASLRYGFGELGLDEIISIYDPENVRSGAVMTRLGLEFRRTAIHPEIGNVLHVHARSRTS